MWLFYFFEWFFITLSLVGIRGVYESMLQLDYISLTGLYFFGLMILQSFITILMDLYKWATGGDRDVEVYWCIKMGIMLCGMILLALVIMLFVWWHLIKDFYFYFTG